MRYSAIGLGRRFWTKPESEEQPERNLQLRTNKYKQAGEHWLARAVGRIDVLLQRCHGVREFTNKRTSLFRIRSRAAERAIELRCGRRIFPGDPIVELHLWNEHFLRTPPGGADLAWGKLIGRRFRDSLGELAIHLDEDTALGATVAVCCCGGIAYEGKVVRLALRFGFEVFSCPDRGPASRLIDFFCDFWSLLLVLAYNPRSTRADLLFGRRCELWLSREVLSGKFGRGAGPNPRLEGSAYARKADSNRGDAETQSRVVSASLICHPGESRDPAARSAR